MRENVPNIYVANVQYFKKKTSESGPKLPDLVDVIIKIAKFKFTILDILLAFKNSGFSTCKPNLSRNTLIIRADWLIARSNNSVC